jgi:hypothetical protein
VAEINQGKYEKNRSSSQESGDEEINCSPFELTVHPKS